jgi:hypothetical protein
VKFRVVWDELTGVAERRRYGYSVLRIAAAELRREAEGIKPDDSPVRHGVLLAADLIDPDREG